MKKLLKRILMLTLTFTLSSAFAFSHGIYITGSTAEHMNKLQNLINQSKKYGIDTFVIDVDSSNNKRFAQNVKSVVAQGIHFVARIVIFPHGGTHRQVTDRTIWAKRLALAKYAIGLGASTIQLDYIRYQAENPPNPAKAKQILKVVQYFKNETAPYHVKLQMDIFGVAALKPAHTIGQDVGLLATVIDAFCPMVYPSHYEPFRHHAVHPYETVFHSIAALKKQLTNHPNVGVFAFIEIYNYRFWLSPSKKAEYILAEMKAATDAGANGWYVWSATNHYSPLFQFLATHPNACQCKKTV
ncbi:MAG: hypothetical protein A3E82_06450 [Gammaproteobacteria bacterium RIFCSPHIGHO2_12_FULL_38_11]|nr:MAG: hypothetical protein A3E82_06450 [Gammaproteobacteria bacterium RIFCSPHIGHO2_12_FULL_38_11]